MNFLNKYCFIWAACFLVLSCNNKPSGSHGPIKLGDSSTIITETDPRRLQDLVIDLKPDIPSSTTAVADTPKTVAVVKNADTAKQKTATGTAAATGAPPPPPAPLPTGPGLKAEFKDVTVLLPNVNAKISGKGNLMNANGAVYTWISGNLAGNVLRTTGIVTKVSQRYQSIVILKTKNGNLPLDELSETTAWKPMNGGNGVYPIAGINENELTYADADANDIRKAVTKAARSRRMNSKKMQEFISALGNVRAANQKPLVVTLRSLMWKIDGKDANGKIYSKQIRIDVPM